MMINSNALVSITEANQNCSKVARLVDEQGAAAVSYTHLDVYKRQAVFHVPDASGLSGGVDGGRLRLCRLPAQTGGRPVWPCVCAADGACGGAAQPLVQPRGRHHFGLAALRCV